MDKKYSPVQPMTEWVATEVAQKVFGTCAGLEGNQHYSGVFTLPLGQYRAIIQNDPGSNQHIRVTVKSPTGRNLVSLFKKDPLRPDKPAEDARRAAVIDTGR